ncbi:hypothetical protein [Coxiella-like endosymbiont of Rhipicephalus sanguineus]|uniref:hypothetical protein n=1 Tax=Coxiella-like endosymbiont of Rhipicephalus sanguineus TaxID=1955402 RepID=UPI00203BD698|nr:hypothetical protein [Coxiella-like endosymbiont of Rhipicephalus sanguineus]
MLLGEYAVLQGKTALVAAINKFISITLKPRSDDRIFIDSALGTLTLHRHQITLQAPFEFVLATLASKSHLPAVILKLTLICLLPLD